MSSFSTGTMAKFQMTYDISDPSRMMFGQQLLDEDSTGAVSQKWFIFGNSSYEASYNVVNGSCVNPSPGQATPFRYPADQFLALDFVDTEVASTYGQCAYHWVGARFDASQTKFDYYELADSPNVPLLQVLIKFSGAPGKTEVKRFNQSTFQPGVAISDLLAIPEECLVSQSS